MLRIFLIATFLLINTWVYSQTRTWGYNNNRIALSFDGNSAADTAYKWKTGSPDDWGAIYASLMIVNHEGLQNKVVREPDKVKTYLEK